MPIDLNPRALLLVEDSDDDVFFMRRALKEAAICNPLHIVDDGQTAIDYLSGSGIYADRAKYPFPALVLLDLKLPLKSGHEVLNWIRRERLDVAVVVLTSSEHPVDLTRSYQLGANSYLVKPPTVEQLHGLVRAFRWDWIQRDLLLPAN